MIQDFLAEKANAELGIDDPDLNPHALLPTTITVEQVEFATAPDNKTPTSDRPG